MLSFYSFFFAPIDLSFSTHFSSSSAPTIFFSFSGSRFLNPNPSFPSSSSFSSSRFQTLTLLMANKPNLLFFTLFAAFQVRVQCLSIKNMFNCYSVKKLGFEVGSVYPSPQIRKPLLDSFTLPATQIMVSIKPVHGKKVEHQGVKIEILGQIGAESLPFFLSHMIILGTDIVVDPCAAILFLVVIGLLCMGIKESSFVQAIATTSNLFVMFFIIIVGGYLGFKIGWTGYELPSGVFLFGVNGMLAGSATIFFACIGFDSVASTAEEVKNPQHDLLLGIWASLSICCSLYILVSVVIVVLMHYYAIDPDTHISSVIASHGM